MSEPIVIYECPTCRRASDGEASDAHCAGAVYDGSVHEPVQMVRLRVFREEDVRAIEAARDRALKFESGLVTAVVEAHKALTAAGVPDPDTDQDEDGDPVGSTVATRIALLAARGPSWEQVRPLWEALREIAGHNYSGWSGGVPDRIAAPALDDFEAPEEWTA